MVRGEMSGHTHEHHPIPQPKHGRGLSNISNRGSSSSFNRMYLPLLSLQSQHCPVLAMNINLLLPHHTQFHSPTSTTYLSSKGLQMSNIMNYTIQQKSLLET